MENKSELSSPLTSLPPVEFCCTYGSYLLPNNHNNKETMVDYILGVSDPLQWHSQNLEMNRDHYASWMVHLGGAELITRVADHVGVGVHFNPFVKWEDKMIKYGVVRMHDLVEDVLSWKSFYLSGRLQKPDVKMPIWNFLLVSNDELKGLYYVPHSFDGSCMVSVLSGFSSSFVTMMNVTDYEHKLEYKRFMGEAKDEDEEEDLEWVEEDRDYVDEIIPWENQEKTEEEEGHEDNEEDEELEEKINALLSYVDELTSFMGELASSVKEMVHVLVDSLDIKDMNSVNLKAATSAALLLLPPQFTEEEVYAKICSLSYMGDMRMLFAEDKDKVSFIKRV
ncbi:hypothetical protein GIB67_016103 [Kingdonia uniflora]|uniref:Phosphatidate cytidylyltransferase, mitochondrial n=1 Tax=Kingdonia uniflora TaxID=39325 RepID=A0A7J7L260_9MAGN|nr:hypothetical protein GIB67_016103 [Kingdonia uniflora]